MPTFRFAPPAPTELGTKAEIKNMNSFRSVHRAIESEIARQIEIVESGGRVVQETRGWDEVTGTTHTMRSKEQAHDYRYFPDPDLVPMEVDRATVERIRAAMPELPPARFARYHGEFKLSVAQATQLDRQCSRSREYFDACVNASKNAQQSVNFVLGDLSRLANESGVPVYDSPVKPEHVAELIALVRIEYDQFKNCKRARCCACGKAKARRRQSSRKKGSRRPATPARSMASSTRCWRRTKNRSPITRAAKPTSWASWWAK